MDIPSHPKNPSQGDSTRNGVETPVSEQGDGKPKGHSDIRRREYEIISGIEKLEGQLADQKERWDTIALLRGKWNEATRIQRTIVASTQELENTKKEVKNLTKVLGELEGKNLQEQNAVLQNYGDIRVLVQKKATKFQKKWFAEQSKLIERYKKIREFLFRDRKILQNTQQGYLTY